MGHWSGYPLIERSFRAELVYRRPMKITSANREEKVRNVSATEAAVAAAAVGDRAYAIGERSLQLLHAIEQTISSLTTDREFVSNAARIVDSFEAELAKAPPVRPIDPEGRIVGLLIKGMEAADRLAATNREKLASAEADVRLTDDDGVTAEYHAFIESVCALHDGLSRLIERIEELDADFEEPLPGTFRSVDELMTALKA